MRTAIATMILLCCTATGALAQPAAADAGKKKTWDPNKKTCRAMETTGSAFAFRECHTAAQWHAIDAANSANREGAATNRVLQHSPGVQVPSLTRN